MALSALVALDKNRSRRLADGLDRHRLEPRESALARELAMGVERNRALLDFVLAGVAHRGLPRDPLVRGVLRLGCYQLLMLGRVPAHAAVHQSVQLAPRLKPLVNALLRQIAGAIRDRPADPERPHLEIGLDGDRALLLPGQGLPRPDQDWVGFHSIRHSLPRFLVDRWREHFGEQAAARVCAASSARPSLYLRVNRRKGSRAELQAALAAEGVATREADHPDLLTWPGGVPPFGGPAYREGWFAVQDPTALAAADALGVQPGETVVDLCAAPGTKATRCAEAAAPAGGPAGRVLAYDPVPARRQLIRDNVDRLGLDGVLEVVADPSQLTPCARVLVDVPCSNTGVLARRVEARRRLRPGVLEDLAVLQDQLLRAGRKLVAPGGRLVYSTCSLEPEENDRVVRRALDGGWRLVEEKLTLPDPLAGDGGYHAVLARS